MLKDSLLLLFSLHSRMSRLRCSYNIFIKDNRRCSRRIKTLLNSIIIDKVKCVRLDSSLGFNLHISKAIDFKSKSSSTSCFIIRHNYFNTKVVES